ncbi:UNVERIFIED_CONTAM: hypothetical protein FKN15_014083 [Acipenser sinensis]
MTLKDKTLACQKEAAQIRSALQLAEEKYQENYRRMQELRSRNFQQISVDVLNEQTVKQVHQTQPVTAQDYRSLGHPNPSEKVQTDRLCMSELLDHVFFEQLPPQVEDPASLFPFCSWCGREDHRWRSCPDGPPADWCGRCEVDGHSWAGCPHNPDQEQLQTPSSAATPPLPTSPPSPPSQEIWDWLMHPEADLFHDLPIAINTLWRRDGGRWEKWEAEHHPASFAELALMVVNYLAVDMGDALFKVELPSREPEGELLPSQEPEGEPLLSREPEGEPLLSREPEGEPLPSPREGEPLPLPREGEPERPQPEREEPERPQPEREEPERPQPEREEPERPQPEREEPERPQPEREEPERPQPEREEPERPRPTPEREEPERPQPEREEPECPQPKREEPEREEPERPQPEREEPERPQPEREEPEREESVRPWPEREESVRPWPEREESVRPWPEREESVRPRPEREESVRPRPEREESIPEDPQTAEEYYYEDGFESCSDEEAEFEDSEEPPLETMYRTCGKDYDLEAMVKCMESVLDNESHEAFAAACFAKDSKAQQDALQMGWPEIVSARENDPEVQDLIQPWQSDQPSFFTLRIHSKTIKPIVPEDNTDLNGSTADPQALYRPQRLLAIVRILHSTQSAFTGCATRVPPQTFFLRSSRPGVTQLQLLLFPCLWTPYKGAEMLGLAKFPPVEASIATLVQAPNLAVLYKDAICPNKQRRVSEVIQSTIGLMALLWIRSAKKDGLAGTCFGGRVSAAVSRVAGGLQR